MTPNVLKDLLKFLVHRRAKRKVINKYNVGRKNSFTKLLVQKITVQNLKLSVPVDVFWFVCLFVCFQ